MSANEMPKAYEAADVENKWYSFWEEHKLFHGKTNPNKKPYSIVIPPPNVTGILTMGHVLNNTLQDILMRRKRMQGYECCWFPGTDHAGIATESKVEKVLQEKEGTGRDKLGREEFIKRVWQWKEQYGGTIIKQLRKLGTSCDWDRERFTMDEGLSKAVRRVFVELYNKGYIHRGRRMINWCPVSRTALSDEEVIYRDEPGKFYHFKYPMADGSGEIIVATTRPETMFGDTAVAVHPDDPRYKGMIGKMVKLPLTDREIPIIGDIHADPTKGTGCVKITPAHDPNDFEVGQRNNLDFICVMDKSAHMNANAGKEFEGMERYEARELVVKKMQELGLVVKIEDLVHAVGYSERGGVAIEPMLSEQWFVKMDELAKPAIEAVKTGKIKFYPERWTKTYFHWMENIKDWCISRQIWWGHRIPAWYRGKETYVGMEAPQGEGWVQEEDVLDTWFSSWLWPFSIMGWPEDTEEQKFFYPTNDLVTGPDIIFFWVARMIMAGCEFKGQIPFSNVYFTSIIRDDLGRKLSKSLGNSPDPLDVIAKYGADALRFSIIYIAPVGMDIRYSNEKCEIGRNFANKLWNACRFRRMQGPVSANYADISDLVKSGKLTGEEKWILQLVDQCTIGMNKALDEFRFHQAAHDIYELVWSSFCDWFIEAEKVRFAAGGEAKEQALKVLDYCLWKLLRLLHPFMPFITEELAHQMDFLGVEESIMYAQNPGSMAEEGAALADGAEVAAMVQNKFDLISAGRTLRISYNVPQGRKIAFHIKAADAAGKAFYESGTDSLKWLLNAETVTVSLEDYKSEDGAGAPSTILAGGAIFMPLKGIVDIEAEKAKLEKQRKDLTGWIKGTEARLNNPKFVEKAPAKVIEDAKAQLEDLRSKLTRVDEALASMK